MYDGPYQEVGPSSDADVLNINNDDLFHFIEFLIFESREWDNEYYNSCDRTKVTSCVCPCSKIMKN